MSFQHTGAAALDYFPCRYGHSKLLFRGPKRRLDGAYCTVLGGSETYGKYVRTPYPALVEAELGLPVVNFGYMNAGADLFLNEPAVMDACAGARVTVIQLLGAHNMSNRFYAVHPRRNDRFLRASQQMRSIFREVDFTQFHFTRHMLAELHNQSPDKFALLVEELKAAWVARMRQMLKSIGGKSVLLWLQQPATDGLGPDPLLIDRLMVDAIRPFAHRVLEVAPDPGSGTHGMEFPALEAHAAALLPGPAAHAEVAAALAPVLRACL